MIVFDAGVLIAHLNDRDLFHAQARHLLEDFEEFDYAASTVTVAEALVHATSAGRASTALAAFERLMLLQLDVTADDVGGIAEVRAATGLRLPDAIVLYTAERHGAHVGTTDRRLHRAALERRIPAELLDTDG